MHGKRYGMGKTTASLPVRRSARVNVCCPVRISGVLGNDRPYVEDARVVTLSKFGAKLKTRIPLQVGMKVKVQPILGDTSGVFNVVWVGREDSPRAGETGVEHPQGTSAVFGISFPESTGPAR
jgi:hypothetical protein